MYRRIFKGHLLIQYIIVKNQFVNELLLLQASVTILIDQITLNSTAEGR